MKVFISWSGDLSKKVAEHLSSWIEDTLQGVKTWVSSEDIDKGQIWFSEITNTLAEAKYGIICLTADNLNNPWILFEAGALSNGLSKNKVCPFLVNVGFSQLVPPLSQLNATKYEKEDVYKLLKSINLEQGDKKISDERLVKTFEMWWGPFDQGMKKILSENTPTKKLPQKSNTELLEEILTTSRSVERSLQGFSITEELLKNIVGSLQKSRYDSLWFGKPTSSINSARSLFEHNEKISKQRAINRGIQKFGSTPPMPEAETDEESKIE